MTHKTPLPWTPATILHLALVEDVDFAVRAVNNHDALLEALERLHLYVTDRDAFEAKYGGPEFPESSGNVEAWLDQEVRGPARAAIEQVKEK